MVRQFLQCLAVVAAIGLVFATAENANGSHRSGGSYGSHGSFGGVSAVAMDRMEVLVACSVAAMAAALAVFSVAIMARTVAMDHMVDMDHMAATPAPVTVATWKPMMRTTSMWTMAALGKRTLSRTTRILRLTNPNRDRATSVRSPAALHPNAAGFVFAPVILSVTLPASKRIPSQTGRIQ